MSRRMLIGACIGSAGLGIAAAASGGPTVFLYSRHPVSSGQFGCAVTTVQSAVPGVRRLVVGAYRERVGTVSQAGRVVVFQDDGTVFRTLVSPNAQTSGFFGQSVGGVPDINGDAIEDILVGAPNELNEDDEFSGRGRVYIFSGATGALVRTLSSPSQEAGGWFGKSVAGIADITGDGRGEVVVGAPHEDPGDQPANSGRAYLFNGAGGQLVRAMSSPNQVTTGEFGHAVAAVPDTNGDGKPEILVSARYEKVMFGPNEIQRAGRVYLINAVNGNRLGTFTSTAPVTDGAFGESVAGIADINGDNKGDILIGSPREVVAGHGDSGRVHLYSGWSRTKIRSFWIGAAQGSELFGTAVASMPDANGDGKMDIVIGAPNATPSDGLQGAGRVFIYSGSAGTFLRALESPLQTRFGWFGAAVAGATDSNGNGKGEVLIGAILEDTANASAPGRGYLIRN